MKYKAKDIARELGMSPATVSLVLNNKPGVGEAKRREILEKIMEMDCEYLLKEGESHKGDIGLVIYKCGGRVSVLQLSVGEHHQDAGEKRLYHGGHVSG